MFISWTQMKADGLFTKLQKVWTRDMLIGLAVGAVLYLGTAIGYVSLNWEKHLPELKRIGLESQVFLNAVIQPWLLFMLLGAAGTLIVIRWLQSLRRRAVADGWKPWMTISITVFDVIMAGSGFLFAGWLFTRLIPG